MVDIGGGSTEAIIGEKDKPLLMESVQIGCARITKKYFESGTLEKKKFKKALVEAKLQFQPITSPIKKTRLGICGRHSRNNSYYSRTHA